MLQPRRSPSIQISICLRGPKGHRAGSTRWTGFKTGLTSTKNTLEEVLQKIDRETVDEVVEKIRGNAETLKMIISEDHKSLVYIIESMIDWSVVHIIRCTGNVESSGTFNQKCLTGTGQCYV